MREGMTTEKDFLKWVCQHVTKAYQGQEVSPCLWLSRTPCRFNLGYHFLYHLRHLEHRSYQVSRLTFQFPYRLDRLLEPHPQHYRCHNPLRQLLSIWLVRLAAWFLPCGGPQSDK